MKQIRLTQGKVAIVDDGDFQWLSQWKWHVSYLGKDHRTTYAARTTRKSEGKKELILMHRQILGASASESVDHVNRNGLDNQRANLRLANHTQNALNHGRRRDNSSGFIGVAWHKRGRCYMAYIAIHKKRKHLGYFDSPVDAAKARDAAARELHQDFAVLNFPEAL